MRLIVQKMPENKNDCLFSAPLDYKINDVNGCHLCEFKSRKSKDDILCDGVNECKFLTTWGMALLGFPDGDLYNAVEEEN